MTATCSIDPPIRTGCNLVLIDDDEFVLERVARHLRKTRWSATYFTDPEDALVHLHERSRPDVLIVDNRMPRMDGIDFIKRLTGDKAPLIPRLYLCSGAHPPADICLRAEQSGVYILSKDTLLEKTELLALLEGC